MTADLQHRLSRRNFLRTLLIGGVGVAILNLIAAVLYFVWPDEEAGRISRSRVTVPAADIPLVWEAPFVDLAGRFYLIHNEDGLLAFSWNCTLRGCNVVWSPRFNDPRRFGGFQCPCCGSLYDRNGVVIDGPAPRPLDLFTINVESSGDLVVNTLRVHHRLRYDPSQATRI